MKAIFGEGDEGKINPIGEETKDIKCTENDHNDMMKVQFTRKEDSSEIRNSKKSTNQYFEMIWSSWNLY